MESKIRELIVPLSERLIKQLKEFEIESISAFYASVRFIKKKSEDWFWDIFRITKKQWITKIAKAKD